MSAETSNDEMTSPDGEVVSPAIPAIDAAYLQGGVKFGSIELQPYSRDRVIACQCMGVRFGFVDDAGLQEYRQTGVYPGMLRDVINHIWIRSLGGEDAEVLIDRAQRDPRWAGKEAAKFAEDNNLLDARSDKFMEAANIFLDTMEAIRISRTEPKKKAKEAPEIG